MKKLYFLNEEEKNRILNLHENATKRQYLGEQDEYRNITFQEYRDSGKIPKGQEKYYQGSGTKRVKTSEFPIKPQVEVKTAPKDTENIEQKLKSLGTQISVDLSMRLARAGLQDAKEKVTGVIFCSVKNGVITADNEYKGKKWDDFVKDFNITNQEIEKVKKACPKKNNSQQYKQQIVTKTTDTTKQIQKLLGLPETGVMDTGLLEKINDKLNGKPQETPKSDVTTQPRPKVEPLQQLTPAGVNTQQITTLNPEQLTAGLQQMQQKVAASTAGLKR